MWIRPSDGGRGKLLLSGLSVSDSPLLSDGCCRHRSMHHTLVIALLLHPPFFRWKSTPSSWINALTDTRTRRAYTRARAHACTTRIQTPFPSWLQILPELVPICELCRGVLYQSNSAVICLSQMDLRGVQGPCLVDTIAWMQTSHDTDSEQSHIYQALRCKRATLQHGGQVNHHGLTRFNPLNHEFTPK